MRVVLDTNVLVSMTLNPNGPFVSAWTGWRAGRFEVANCYELMQEVSEVLARPKLAKRVNLNDVNALNYLLERHSLTFELVKPYPEFEDEDDRFLLALASESSASALVTGDGALRTLERVGETLVISPAEFMNVLA